MAKAVPNRRCRKNPKAAWAAFSKVAKMAHCFPEAEKALRRTLTEGAFGVREFIPAFDDVTVLSVNFLVYSHPSIRRGGPRANRPSA
jgi:hypothetical protein